jgi:integrase/recombinase XerD
METLREYSDFIKEKEQDLSVYTVTFYKASIERFLKHFSIETLDQLKALTINEYREYREKLLFDGLGKSSCNAHMRNISFFLGWLANYDMIEAVPIGKIKPLKLPKKQITSLTQEECRRMVDATKNLSKKVMFVIMFQTGMRRSEIIGMKLTDIYENKVLVHGKGNKERILTLTNETLVLLQKYLSKRKIQSEYVFCNAYGHALSGESIRLRIKAAAKRAGIDPERILKITPHTTRKTFATNLVDLGVPINVIQNALGHSSVITTMLYAKTQEENVKNAMLMQGNLLGEK